MRGGRVVELFSSSHIVLCVLETVWVHVCIRTNMGYVSRAHVCILYEIVCACSYTPVFVVDVYLLPPPIIVVAYRGPGLIFNTQPVSMQSSNSNGM